MSSAFKMSPPMANNLLDTGVAPDPDTQMVGIAPLVGAIAGLGEVVTALESRREAEKSESAKKAAKSAKTKVHLGHAIDYLEQALALLENPR